MQKANNNGSDEFGKKIGSQAQRKIKALKNNQSVWFGLGMMGIIGWTIVVPTLLGAALGVWLDKKDPEPFSWTLSGLVIGLVTGCSIGWRWINKEHKEINTNDND